MKRYTNRVEKALNLSKEEFDSFLTLLRSEDESSLQVALSIMRGQANATVKEMKAMFATYVVMPIFESEKEIMERRKSSLHYENLNVMIMAHMKYKAWVGIQLYYIKKFVKCSPAELNKSTSYLSASLNKNIWGKYIDFSIDIMNTFTLFSQCVNKLYGTNYNYW